MNLPFTIRILFEYAGQSGKAALRQLPPKNHILYLFCITVSSFLPVQTPLESNSQICISGKGNDSVLLINLYFTL